MRISDWSSDVCSSDLVTFHGDKVEAPNVPLNAVDLELTLQDGLLHLKPLRLGVAGGLVNADIRLDARHDPVTTDYDIRLSKFRLERFLDSAGLSRSEERRGGKECVSTCSSRWAQYQ